MLPQAGGWGGVVGDSLARLPRSSPRRDNQNLHLLNGLKGKEIPFPDPLLQVHGIRALQAYSAELYRNVGQLLFDFTPSTTWPMARVICAGP